MLDDRSYMRESYRPARSMTSVLLIANIVCFVVQFFVEHFWTRFPFRDYFALSVEGLRHGLVYQVITFQFLHSNAWHLLGNLIAIYFFGRPMEDALGGKGMLKLYLLSGTIGGLVQTALGFAFPDHFGGHVLGASAGAFGLIAAFATRAPDQPITLLLFFILPLTFPAKVLLIGEAALAVFGMVEGGPIAHAAHLGGMLTGIFYIRWLASERSMTLWQARRRRAPREVVSATPKRAWRKPRKKLEDVTPAEFISKEVDPILEKISAHGIHSLTERERQILEAARHKMAKR